MNDTVQVFDTNHIGGVFETYFETFPERVIYNSFPGIKKGFLAVRS